MYSIGQYVALLVNRLEKIQRGTTEEQPVSPLDSVWNLTTRRHGIKLNFMCSPYFVMLNILHDLSVNILI